MITPYEKYDNLARAIGLSSHLFFKREDLHPLGSHKGRSLPIMIDKYIKEGFDHFAISSSGNAALASGLYIKKLNENRDDNKKIVLEILFGKNIQAEKLEKLEKLKDKSILISIHDRPLQALFIKIENPKIKSLRQSTDDTALIGYQSLAKELLEIPELKAIFIGVSSGTTAQALAEYFIKNKKKIEIHIVQTTSCHSMIDALGKSNTYNESSIANAIVDYTAKRKDVLVDLINKTGGTGWIAKNEIIKSVENLVKNNTDISLSPNGALPVAGLMEAIYTGESWDGSVACIICGD